MNKKKLVYIVVTLIIILVGVSIFIIITKTDNKGTSYSGVEKNYGLAYQSNNITIQDGNLNNEGGFDVSTVVPDRETLINNLKNKGFEIEYSEKVFDSNIKATQILAKKGKRFLNISYDIEGEEESVFDLYNKYYEEDKYYILALNVNYVYAVSGKSTFNDAGFTSLANNGIQFINHSNERL